VTLALAASLGACARGGDATGGPSSTPAQPAGAAAPVATAVASARQPEPSAARAAPPAAKSAATSAAAPASSATAPAPSAAPPAPSVTPAPSPLATGPQIYSLSATPTVVHAGQQVSFSARTTDDIASVTAFVSAYSLPFTRTSPGRFALAFAVPANVPGFFRGTYAMNVVARSAQGASVSRSISITFQ
jgi:hypothetical protein